MTVELRAKLFVREILLAIHLMVQWLCVTWRGPVQKISPTFISSITGKKNCQHVPITQSIDSNSVPSLIFKKIWSNHSRPKSAPNSGLRTTWHMSKNRMTKLSQHPKLPLSKNKVPIEKPFISAYFVNFSFFDCKTFLKFNLKIMKFATMYITNSIGSKIQDI